MLFNSIEFALFLSILFLLYWYAFRSNLLQQNILLLVASYVFYGSWDYRYLLILLFVSLGNYFIGLKTDRSTTDRSRKGWLITGIILNLVILCIFKYFNFFIDSFIDLVSLTGYHIPRSSTRIILPIGISFYIFLSISYLIDIHRRTITASKNIIHVLLTFSFFPIILAGPIQRPATLIPQLSNKRNFDRNQAVDGLRQMLWGVFVKIVIADNLARYTDDFFINYTHYSGSTLLLGALFYSIQIYADFSGYSDMAIGIAKLFGFKLMRNFAYPYFSRDITEFWKRWHMSLTGWFRDYLFLPLSFNISYKIKGERVLYIKTDMFIYIAASLLTWMLTGFWHGANYTFLIWGLLHGILLIAYRWTKAPRKRLFKKVGIDNKSKIVVGIETFFTLFIVMLAWVVFRSDSISNASHYLSRMFSASLLSIPKFPGMKTAFISAVLAIIFFLTEWIGRNQEYAIAGLGSVRLTWLRLTAYYALIILILLFGGSDQQFIYFQF